MTTNITNLFKTEYQTDVHHVFQREGAYLKGAVRTKDSVVGTSTRFNKVGKGTATTKARHGQITPMNGDRSQVPCELEDWYAGDWYDDLDSAKQETDEKMTIAKSGAMCLGRKVDELIITALDGTTNTTSAWTLTNSGTILASALAFVEALWANDVPNDGNNYAIVTPRCWSQLMTVEQFSNSQFVGPDGLPFKGGALTNRWKEWMGVKWQFHVGLTESFTGTAAASRKIYAWNRAAVGFAMAKHAKNIASNPSVVADITWHGDHASWFINHLFSAGACVIDAAGVIEGSLDDTAAIATS